MTNRFYCFGLSLVCLILSCAWTAPGTQSDSLTERLKQGQEAMYRLRYQQARGIFAGIRNQYPEQPAGYGMLSILSLNELLRAAMNLALDDYSTPSPFAKGRTAKLIDLPTRRFREANEALMSKCDVLLARNPNDAEALYFKGLGYENLAGEAIVVTKEQSAAINYGRRTKSLHERTLQLDPRFVDAEISLAAHEYASANLPWKIRWLTFLLGIRGNEKRAFERLRVVSERGRYRSYDAMTLLGFMKAWKGKRREAGEAVDVFERLRRKFPENYLLDINLAAIYERTELNDPKAALRVYEDLLRSLDSKTPGLEAGEVYYRLGRTEFRLRDYSRALEAFEQALSSKKGEAETEPLAYYYCGLIHETQGARPRAQECFRKALRRGSLPGIQKELAEARKRL